MIERFRDWISQWSVRIGYRLLRRALHKDYGFAWAWHCNVAMSFYDEMPRAWPAAYKHEMANKAAARFMNIAFDVDTSKEPS